MSGTIVVGVDESAGSADALRWAVAEARIRGTDVLAVMAWGFLDQHTDALEGFNPEYRESDAEAALEKIVAAALPADQAAGVRRRAVCDLPARALLDVAGAADVDTDLLAVGARGLGGFRGLLLGSVSQHCVHHARVPTVVVRSGADAPDGGVVVGIDGSATAQRALAWAADEARRRHAPLTVVHGYHGPPIGAYPYSTMTLDPTVMEQAARRLVTHAVDQLDATGLDLTTRTIGGGGALAVLDQSEDAGLVVVGSRGLGAVQRLLLGSVATQVVLHARGPVAVIPPAT